MLVMRAVKVLFFTVLVFATATLAAEAAKADAPKSASIVVDGPWITLGDLFETSGPAADAQVSESPAPGQRAVLSARRIAAVAKENGIDWAPGGITGISVQRSGDLVSRALILEALADALSIAAGKDLAPEISNATFRLYVPSGAAVSLAVEDLDFDPSRGTFSASLVAPASDPDALRAEVRGRAFEISEVPVLVRAVAVGGVIQESDIGWVDVRVDRLRSNTITEYALLAGQSPKRPLRINEPVRLNDVQRPVVIAKGASVLMVVEAPGLLVSAVGRALSDGGAGETIQVQNVQTHTTVEGVVEGPGQVRVLLRKTIVQARN